MSNDKAQIANEILIRKAEIQMLLSFEFWHSFVIWILAFIFVKSYKIKIKRLNADC
jgi:hypothetical protein